MLEIPAFKYLIPFYNTSKNIRKCRNEKKRKNADGQERDETQRSRAFRLQDADYIPSQERLPSTATAT
jgi:hypothetical protein